MANLILRCDSVLNYPSAVNSADELTNKLIEFCKRKDWKYQGFIRYLGYKIKPYEENMLYREYWSYPIEPIPHYPFLVFINYERKVIGTKYADYFVGYIDEHISN
jgi:hypothetical protein